MRKSTKCSICEKLPSEQFVPIPHRVVGLPKSELNVYAAIRSFRNGQTGKCYPGMKTIVNRSGRSLNTVQAAKRALWDRGLLRWEVRGRMHLYWFPEPGDPLD